MLARLSAVRSCSSLATRRPVASLTCTRALAASSSSVLPSSSAPTLAASCTRSFSAESHSDFAPKSKVFQDDPAKLKTQVDKLISSHPVVLFMKGTPQQPMCGFSNKVVQLLHSEDVDIFGVDILSNATLRTYMKEYSSWPTFPQLYVNGEFVGGCDIAVQMYQSGELQTLLKSAKAKDGETAKKAE